MARTPSTMLELGTVVPDFSLEDTDGLLRRPKDRPTGQPLVVMFISNHCPFVINMKPALARFGQDYAAAVTVYAIGSNDIKKYPQDGPDHSRADKAKYGYPFPYLHDAKQAVARKFRAACTPDFYLFDGNDRLVYRGQFDDSRPGNDIEPDGSDLRAACDAILTGRAVDDHQKPSLGCSIKWAPGNEPDYFG